MKNSDRYGHLIHDVELFFRAKLRYEGQGTDHADFVSDDKTIVGEIKHAGEIATEEQWQKFWEYWNFKKKLTATFQNHTTYSRCVKGFLALVLGQLYNQVSHFKGKQGWLVLEYAMRWQSKIDQAINMLSSVGVDVKREIRICSSVMLDIFKCDFKAYQGRMVTVLTRSTDEG